MFLIGDEVSEEMYHTFCLMEDVETEFLIDYNQKSIEILLSQIFLCKESILDGKWILWEA